MAKNAVSVVLPEEIVEKLDKRATALRRSRAYVLSALMDTALDKHAEDESFRPVHESNGETQQVTFQYQRLRVIKLTSWAKKEGWKRAQLVRNIIAESLVNGWLQQVQ